MDSKVTYVHPSPSLQWLYTAKIQNGPQNIGLMIPGQGQPIRLQTLSRWVEIMTSAVADTYVPANHFWDCDFHELFKDTWGSARWLQSPPS